MNQLLTSEDSSAPRVADAWTSAQIAAIPMQQTKAPPTIAETDFARIAPDIDIWDAWPVQDEDGSPSVLAGGVTLWMALGAPRFPDPDERHGHARIHLLQRDGGGWRHLGPVMPDGFSPGSREWSGSAVLDRNHSTLRMYFTATGRRGEAELTFEQRLFLATAELSGNPGSYCFDEWQGLREIVIRDPAHYMASDAGDGVIGTIKAFRDPAYFRDPADGTHYLFFAGSRADANSSYNGVIGAAMAPSDKPDDWRILPPLLDATGINNELERPHVVRHQGQYYLFWSTQSHVFNPQNYVGPTGLYAMVANSVRGPWHPLNHTGLVFGNPSATPRQAYSWLVLPDLSVISFVDDWGQGADSTEPRRFGATFAPVLNIHLQGRTGGLKA